MEVATCGKVENDTLETKKKKKKKKKKNIVTLSVAALSIERLTVHLNKLHKL